MPSTITTPVATRIPSSDVENLRALARRRGQTVSSLLAELAAQELRKAA